MVQVYSFVAGCLVDYAMGIPTIKTVKPYGLKASRSEQVFKALPSGILALTFAALYQVVRTPPDLLDKWVQKPRPNITSPWPRGTILRFVRLQKVFCTNRKVLFKTYELQGGKYMGKDESEPVQEPVHEPDFEEDFE
jgi:hypothetical protein